MTTWALIPCTKNKQDYPCTAREMYRPSALFRGAWEVATGNEEQILILSAKYGMLRPGDRIEPYDETLSGAPRKRKHEWAFNLFHGPEPRITDWIRPGDTVVSYLGADYAVFLLPWLESRGVTVKQPLKGMSQGKRLQWFKSWRDEAC